MKAVRDIRVLPVVLVAVLSLTGLKIAGLMSDGGYVFDYRTEPRNVTAVPASHDKSWARDTFNFPGGTRETDVTGSVPAKKEEPKVEAKPAAPEPPPQNVFEPPPSVSPSERAVLERLQARRLELDARAREIEITENLLKAAERRIEGRTDDGKASDKAPDKAAPGAEKAGPATAEKDRAEPEVKGLKNLVIMYEGMKPKDAAKVFDRLDMGVLLEISSQIAPRKMSDILGLMQPEAAEKLTVELARKAGASAGPARAATMGELPKIEGRPITPR